MKLIARLILSPAILTTYATYGAVLAAQSCRDDCTLLSSLKHGLSGCVAGFAHGSYYIVSGRKLSNSLFDE
jgi:hypothetical protein